MAFCDSRCAVALPSPLGTACVPEQRSGGIKYVVFARCDVSFVDIGDKFEWCRLIQSRAIVASSELLAQMPAGSAVRKQTSSCRGEVTTGYDYTVTFQDYNADNTMFSDYKFWNTISYNYSSYQIGFLTCSGLLLGYDPSVNSFINNWSIEVSPIIEETINDSSYWAGTISWKGFVQPIPVMVPGLDQLLTGGCDSLLPVSQGGQAREFIVGGRSILVAPGEAIVAFQVTGTSAADEQLTLFNINALSGTNTPNPASVYAVSSAGLTAAQVAKGFATFLHDLQPGVIAYTHDDGFGGGDPEVVVVRLSLTAGNKSLFGVLFTPDDTCTNFTHRLEPRRVAGTGSNIGTILQPWACNI